MQSRWFPFICLAVMLAFSVNVYGQLPDEVPVHWNAAGEVDGTTSPIIAAVILPLVALLMVPMFSIIRAVDHDARDKFERTFYLIRNLTIVFMAAIHVAILSNAAGWGFEMARALGFGIGLVFLLLGSTLSRIQPNGMIGIRTPRTLSNDAIWKRTHEVGGRALFGIGLVMLAASLTIPVALIIPLLLVLVLGWVGYIIYYSYSLPRMI